jgi:hypothetical protein
MVSVLQILFSCNIINKLDNLNCEVWVPTLCRYTTIWYHNPVEHTIHFYSCGKPQNSTLWIEAQLQAPTKHSTTGTVTNVNSAFLNSFTGRYFLPFLLFKLHITKFSNSYNYKGAVTSNEAFKEGVLVIPSKEPFWIQSGFSSVEHRSFLFYLYK